MFCPVCIAVSTALVCIVIVSLDQSAFVLSYNLHCPFLVPYVHCSFLVAHVQYAFKFLSAVHCPMVFLVHSMISSVHRHISYLCAMCSPLKQTVTGILLHCAFLHPKTWCIDPPVHCKEACIAILTAAVCTSVH